MASEEGGRDPAEEAPPFAPAADRESEPSGAPTRGEGSEPVLPAGDPQALLSSTRERIQQVLRTTDAAAQSILEAAKAEADAHVSETRRRVDELTRDRIERLSRVTEDLLGEAERARGEVDGLRAALSRAAQTLAADLEPTPEGRETPASAPPAESPAPEAAVDTAEGAESTPSSSEASPEPLPSASPAAVSEPAAAAPATIEPIGAAEAPAEVVEIFILKLLAGGADRAAVERGLVEEFGVSDPSGLLEALDIFAPRR